MSKPMFDIIKKQNGELFAKAIRNYDNGIFDVPDIDKIVKYAGRDVEPIMQYLVSLKNVKIDEMSVHQDPVMLLNKAGYNAFVVNNLDEQNAIKKYFAPGEELCTFRDKDRFKNYYIINAVRKNVDEIQREKFKKPEREDEYGTSVISIQVLKSGGFISIKNRYNHAVQNPDNTFNSNPDNIILGLSDAIKHHFNVDFSAQKVMLPNGYTQINDQIIKYNYENNNIYVGDDFYVVDGVVFEIDKNSELFLDTVLFNTKTHLFRDVTESQHEQFNAGAKLFSDITKNKKISIRKNPDGTRSFMADEIQIAKLYGGKIVALNLPEVKEINFLPNHFGAYIQNLNIPDTELLPPYFLYSNSDLVELNAPNLKEIKDNSFFENRRLKVLDLPKIEKINNSCFYHNNAISEMNMPVLRTIGMRGFSKNSGLRSLSLPSLEKMGNNCFESNTDISDLNLSNLVEMGECCFMNNKALKRIDLTSLKIMHNSCFKYNENLHDLNLPVLREMGAMCFEKVNNIDVLELPLLEIMKDYCFQYNKTISEINTPKLRKMGDGCFNGNLQMKSLKFPNLEVIGHSCFAVNNSIVSLDAPKLREIGTQSFMLNNVLNSLNLPSLKKMGTYCFYYNEKIQKKLQNIVREDGSVSTSDGVVIKVSNTRDDLLKAINKLKPKNPKISEVENDR